jgi:hypothetical protein
MEEKQRRLDMDLTHFTEEGKLNVQRETFDHSEDPHDQTDLWAESHRVNLTRMTRKMEVQRRQQRAVIIAIVTVCISAMLVVTIVSL